MVVSKPDLSAADAWRLQHSSVPLVATNEQDVIIAVSDGWLALLGYTRDDVIGQANSAFWAPGRIAPPAPCQSIDPTPSEVHDIEGRYAHRDGTMIDMRVLSRRDGATMIAELVDLSAHKRAMSALDLTEDVRRQAERMQALGQLAAGIVHDFNNILQAVSGAAYLIKARPEDRDRVCQLAQAVIRATTQGASITQRLLLFARHDDPHAEPIATAEFLHSVQDLLTRTLGTTITVIADIAPDIPPMLADRGQLDTAMINIAINARDAMPDGGKLVLAAVAEQVGEGEQHPAGLAPGHYVRLSVTDTGTGIDKAMLARVAEPFFTTKSKGQGTGLGLSMVRNFATQSKGGLWITSTPHMGTIVRLWLCQALAAEHISDREADDGRTVPTCSARILLVDDDEAICELLARQLEFHGFSIVTAASGDAALGLVASEEKLDAVVVDFSMPGLSGIETIKRIRALRPQLPCILLTGYTDESLRQSHNNAFILLHKPISSRELAAQIAARLQSG